MITALVSASSIEVARRVQKDFWVDHIYANELVIKDGKGSGEFVWPIGSGQHKKAEIIRELCKSLEIKTSETIYIGDSIKDLEAFKEVGLAIAFNTDSDELKEAADYLLESEKLSDVIKIFEKENI